MISWVRIWLSWLSACTHTSLGQITSALSLLSLLAAVKFRTDHQRQLSTPHGHLPQGLHPMPKRIPLTSSDECAIVDDEDFERINRYKWRRKFDGYAVRSSYKGEAKTTL